MPGLTFTSWVRCGGPHAHAPVLSAPQGGPLPGWVCFVCLRPKPLLPPPSQVLSQKVKPCMHARATHHSCPHARHAAREHTRPARCLHPAPGCTDLLRGDAGEAFPADFLAGPEALAAVVDALLADAAGLAATAVRALRKARSWDEAANAESLTGIIRHAMLASPPPPSSEQAVPAVAV